MGGGGLTILSSFCQLIERGAGRIVKIDWIFVCLPPRPVKCTPNTCYHHPAYPLCNSTLGPSVLIDFATLNLVIFINEFGRERFVKHLVVQHDIIPLRERGKYLVIVMYSMAVAAILGPVIGEALADVNQRWIFYLNLHISGFTSHYNLLTYPFVLDT